MLYLNLSNITDWHNTKVDNFVSLGDFF
jgi:hypothetical protein